MSAVSAAFLSTPPCAELHLHIEGTLEPAMVLALAEKHGITPAAPDVDAFAALYDFTDLSHFLSLYYANTDVLRDAEDFADLTRAYLRRAADGGVMHAEIMFDPQAHLGRGIPLAAVVEGIAAGLADGERELGVTTGLIAAFLRDRPAAEADAVLTELLDLEAPLLGIGLDSAEVGYPPVLFRDLFARAASSASTVWPTPARRAHPSTSPEPWTCSVPSASTTASAASRTPGWSSAWPNSACR